MKKLALLILTVTLSSAALAQEDYTKPYVLYISPTGDDGNAGTAASPLGSMSRANALLEQLNPDADVVVKLISDRGPYIDQSVAWTYYNSKHSITFESEPSTSNATFTSGDDPPSEPFFSFYADNGEATNITIRNITVSNYRSRAILFAGDRENRGGWNGHNTITDCTFEHIGNLKAPRGPIVYSVIGVVNSRNNEISNCVFANISNCTAATFPQKRIAGLRKSQKRAYENVREYEAGGCLGTSSNPNLPIIGIYIAHHSDSNSVRNCAFRFVKGDVVRIRDDSNYTYVADNTMEVVGWHGVVTTWHCTGETGHCTKNEAEKPSRGIFILDNEVRGNWLYGMPRIYFDMNSSTQAGDSFCDATSISMEGNTLTSFHYE